MENKKTNLIEIAHNQTIIMDKKIALMIQKVSDDSCEELSDTEIDSIDINKIKDCISCKNSFIQELFKHDFAKNEEELHYKLDMKNKKNDNMIEFFSNKLFIRRLDKSFNKLLENTDDNFEISTILDR